MSGSELNRPSVGLSGVRSATTTFRGYRIAAITTYVVSDIALVAAMVAFLVVDLPTALAIGAVGVVLTLIALRCGQIVFARNFREGRIPADERIEYEFGARRAIALSTLRSPVLVLVTDRAVHVFVVGVRTRAAILAVNRSPGNSLRQSSTTRSGDADLHLGLQTIPLRGVSTATIDQANALLG